MRCGRVSCRSWVLAIFLLLALPFSDYVYSGRSLNVSSRCRQIWKTQVVLSTAERWVFTCGLQVTSWFYANGTVSTNNSADYAFFVCFVRSVRPRFLRLRNARRQSHPWIYYANTVSTFQPLLEGDLVFKLNLGPDKSYQIPSRSAYGGGCRQGTKRSSRNSENLFRINCSNGVPLLNGNRSQSLLLCSLNTCSVRNKTADVFDYAFDCKADLFTFTKSWLREGDDAVRAELCPDCYQFGSLIVSGNGVIFLPTLKNK